MSIPGDANAQDVVPAGRLGQLYLNTETQTVCGVVGGFEVVVDGEGFATTTSWISKSSGFRSSSLSRVYVDYYFHAVSYSVLGVRLIGFVWRMRLLLLVE